MICDATCRCVHKFNTSSEHVPAGSEAKNGGYRNPKLPAAGSRLFLFLFSFLSFFRVISMKNSSIAQCLSEVLGSFEEHIFECRLSDNKEKLVPCFLNYPALLNFVLSISYRQSVHFFNVCLVPGSKWLFHEDLVCVSVFAERRDLE